MAWVKIWRINKCVYLMHFKIVVFNVTVHAEYKGSPEGGGARGSDFRIFYSKAKNNNNSKSVLIVVHFPPPPHKNLNHGPPMTEYNKLIK